MYRDIPEGSIEVQVGLWAKAFTVSAGSITRTGHKLYSAPGYCFYQISQPENYDEEGNLKPAAERVYATYASAAYATVEEINADVVSVPYEEGYEVVSVGGPKPEVM